MGKAPVKNTIKTKNQTKNILICGVGGQGVILASSVISSALIKAGYDVKKSEVHGMSQRGGAVTSHIRFGKKVYSPIIPGGETDYLLSLNSRETTRNQHELKKNGVVLECPAELAEKLEDIRSVNICLVGILSAHLDIKEDIWKSIIEEKIAKKILDLNIRSFNLGREYEMRLKK